MSNESEEYGGMNGVLLEEAQQPSILDDPHRNLRELGTGSGLPQMRDCGAVKTETERPNVVLVCADCRAYYEHKSGWEHCPRCSEELLEVEKE